MIDLDDYGTTPDEYMEIERDRIIEIVKQLGKKSEIHRRYGMGLICPHCLIEELSSQNINNAKSGVKK